MKSSGNCTFIHGLPAVIHRMRQALPALLILLLLSTPASSAADEAQSTEYRIKTAFLYNFARFVSWPEAALQEHSEFSLCTLGNTRFEEQLDTLGGKTVHGKKLVVKRLDQPEDALNCQLVFLGRSDAPGDILWMLREHPVLTVSDAAAFTEKGGMIEFKVVDNKIRFRINADAASMAGLTISSKLLSLAIHVTGGR